MKLREFGRGLLVVSFTISAMAVGIVAAFKAGMMYRNHTAYTQLDKGTAVEMSQVVVKGLSTAEAGFMTGVISEYERTTDTIPGYLMRSKSSMNRAGAEAHDRIRTAGVEWQRENRLDAQEISKLSAIVTSRFTRSQVLQKEFKRDLMSAGMDAMNAETFSSLTMLWGFFAAAKNDVMVDERILTRITRIITQEKPEYQQVIVDNRHKASAFFEPQVKGNRTALMQIQNSINALPAISMEGLSGQNTRTFLDPDFGTPVDRPNISRVPTVDPFREPVTVNVGQEGIADVPAD